VKPLARAWLYGFGGTLGVLSAVMVGAYGFGRLGERFLKGVIREAEQALEDAASRVAGPDQHD
jgi:F0F1-type ATP synthase membrane subunit c/vacuolar-type H+-ATPase subunit K